MVKLYHTKRSFLLTLYNKNIFAGTLTAIIGIVIIYMEPLMLSIDVIGSIINQKPMIVLMERMQRVDDKLLKENIEIDYGKTKRLTIILIILATIMETSLVIYNFILFQDVMLQSFWWLITCIPLYSSSLAKIWYITLVFNVKQKFTAINDHFEHTSLFFEELKKKMTKSKQKLNDLDDDDSPFVENVDHGGYLHREIYPKPLFKRSNKIQTGDYNVSAHSKNDIVQVVPYNGR